jgi:hypothetical protein
VPGRVRGIVTLALWYAAARRRMLVQGAQEYHRSARGRVAAGELSVAEYDWVQAEVDDAVDDRYVTMPSTAARITIEHAALGSGAGRTPWSNAKAATGWAPLFAWPIIGLECWPTSCRTRRSSSPTP